jgi:hypothetical protein
MVLKSHGYGVRGYRLWCQRVPVMVVVCRTGPQHRCPPISHRMPCCVARQRHPQACGVTVVLQWCYSGITMVLQWCYSGVTVLLQWC